MSKKSIAVIAEAVSPISAVLAISLMVSPLDSPMIRMVITITTLLGFMGFVFFFTGRMLAKDDKTVKILGVLDILATLSIIGFYVIAIFAFGL